MGLARAVHSLVVDIDQLNGLYHQLQVQRVPSEVQTLFRDLDHLYGRLIDISGHLILPRANYLSDRYVREFVKFRRHLVDLELFIDPDQSLPRSGLGNNQHHVHEWPKHDEVTLREYCVRFSNELCTVDAVCKEALLEINPYYVDPMATPDSKDFYFDSPVPGMVGMDSPSFPSPFSLTPALTPLMTPLISPLGSPRQSPMIQPMAATPLSILGLASGPPYFATPPLTYGETFMKTPELPAKNPLRDPRRHRKRDKTVAERRVQQLLEQEYGKTAAAGVKRKRHDTETSNSSRKSLVSAPFPPDGSPQTSGYDSPPPVYPPSSVRLGPSDVPYEHPTWSLDDLIDALPAVPTTRAKGKQRASPDSSPVRDWDGSSSIYTPSSSDNTHSSHSSVREGSILSVSVPPSENLPGHAFEPGSCKLWYNQGSRLNQLIVINIEIRKQPMPCGNSAITIVLRTDTGQEILDSLWMPQTNSNASPFLEHSEIVAAMRDQHDTTIQSVVHFAPNPGKHPQYSFTTNADCEDFMRAVVGKLLVSSVDIATIKSACTHGNSYEVGCETMQIWQDPDAAAGISSRTIKIFRNKNPTASAAVVEIAVSCLKAPDKEFRSGKLSFGLRDMKDDHVREMKYLKIAFSNNLARDEFLCQTGFIDSDR